MYPGDNEFTFENYSSLPYQYVVDAYTHGIKNRQTYLHQLEAPTSLLSSLFANSNRDAKKQKTPYKMNDFFLYQPQEDQDSPEGASGAAAMKLVEQRKFPQWALTFFSDLKNSASGEAPDLLAYTHEKAIVLAPVVDESFVRGMLIADEVVSEQIIEMRSNHGDILKLQMPKLSIRYTAQEGLALPIHE